MSEGVEILLAEDNPGDARHRKGHHAIALLDDIQIIQHGEVVMEESKMSTVKFLLTD